MKCIEKNGPVREWEHARALLLEKERHLTQLSLRSARGHGPDELDALRTEVDRLRLLDGVMFKLAFPFPLLDD
jgi:hypothetical protein